MLTYVVDFADVRLTVTLGQVAEMLQPVDGYESLAALHFGLFRLLQRIIVACVYIPDPVKE